MVYYIAEAFEGLYIYLWVCIDVYGMYVDIYVCVLYIILDWFTC